MSASVVSGPRLPTRDDVADHPELGFSYAMLCPEIAEEVNRYVFFMGLTPAMQLDAMQMAGRVEVEERVDKNTIVKRAYRFPSSKHAPRSQKLHHDALNYHPDRKEGVIMQALLPTAYRGLESGMKRLEILRAVIERTGPLPEREFEFGISLNHSDIRSIFAIMGHPDHTYQCPMASDRFHYGFLIESVAKFTRCPSYLFQVSSLGALDQSHTTVGEFVLNTEHRMYVTTPSGVQLKRTFMTVEELEILLDGGINFSKEKFSVRTLASEMWSRAFGTYTEEKLCLKRFIDTGGEESKVSLRKYEREEFDFLALKYFALFPEFFNDEVNLIERVIGEHPLDTIYKQAIVFNAIKNSDEREKFAELFLSQEHAASTMKHFKSVVGPSLDRG